MVDRRWIRSIEWADLTPVRVLDSDAGLMKREAGVESEPGRGSVFHITLPLAAPATADSSGP